MPACPTVKIKASHASQGDFVEINESDFDAAKGHELYMPILPSLPKPQTAGKLAPPPIK